MIPTLMKKLRRQFPEVKFRRRILAKSELQSKPTTRIIATLPKKPGSKNVDNLADAICDCYSKSGRYSYEILGGTVRNTVFVVRTKVRRLSTYCYIRIAHSKTVEISIGS